MPTHTGIKDSILVMQQILVLRIQLLSC